MKLKIYYDRDTDTLSLWNGRPGSEAENVAEHLVADFNDAGEVVGFTMEHASELLGVIPSIPNSPDQCSERKSVSRLFGILKYEGPPVTLQEMEDAIVRGTRRNTINSNNKPEEHDKWRRK